MPHLISKVSNPVHPWEQYLRYVPYQDLAGYNILTNYFVHSLIIYRDSNKLYPLQSLFCFDVVVSIGTFYCYGPTERKLWQRVFVNGCSMLQIRLLNSITWQPVVEFSHCDVISDNDCTVHQECLAREDPSKVSCKYLLVKIIVA
jgi:hypothetical protein